jgi:hypothetical protein
MMSAALFEDKRIVAAKEGWPHSPSEPIARHVAGDGRSGQTEEQHHNVNAQQLGACAAQQAGYKHQGIAGKEEANHKACFCKHHEQEQGQASILDNGGRIGECF